MPGQLVGRGGFGWFDGPGTFGKLSRCGRFGGLSGCGRLAGSDSFAGFRGFNGPGKLSDFGRRSGLNRLSPITGFIGIGQLGGFGGFAARGGNLGGGGSLVSSRSGGSLGVVALPVGTCFRSGSRRCGVGPVGVVGRRCAGR